MGNNNDAIRSNNEFSKSTCQLQIKKVPAEMEIPEVDFITYSRKRRKTEISALAKFPNIISHWAGLSVSELQLPEAECEVDDDIYCDNCGAYCFDLYRSCECGYDLCLVCCRDLRDGEGSKGVNCGWKLCRDGRIPCPPKDIGGCNDGILELKRIMPVDWVVNVLEKAQRIYKINTSDDFDTPQTCTKCGMCFDSGNETIQHIQPQDMQHFQLHWSKGEPIVVNDVLSTSLGLSWEPMVLIGCLPFKDYTHPQNGYLNVAVKLPDLSLKPDVGPRIDVAYGVEQELENGNSVTKLHYDKSDTVNVLTHTQSPLITSTNVYNTKMAKQKHVDQDEALLCEVDEDQQGVVDTMKEGALWDIFRRQDIPKLEKYLRNHSAEFLHADCLSVKQIVLPIHDRFFYLNMEHKRKLKEEFGIEPWTFKQKLGDAVFIPAGCPYQVRNLKSSTKVELNFVSPESLGACILLQHELCMLPSNHRAQQNKLNMGKMMLYALDHAVGDLAGVSDPNESIGELQFVKASETLNGYHANGFNHTNGWLSDTESNDSSHRVDHESTIHEAFSTLTPETSEDPHETEGLWQGNAVGPEAKKLLEAIELQYPDTFQGVQIRAKAMWLSILNEFHVVIKRFLETSVDALAEERITSLQEDLNEFKRLGFNVSWAHKMLEMVQKLKFGNDPLQQELMTLEVSLEPLKERLGELQKEYVEVGEKLMETQLEYDNATDARNKKALEMAQRYGAEYDQVLKGHLGFGILPGY